MSTSSRVTTSSRPSPSRSPAHSTRRSESLGGSLSAPAAGGACAADRCRHASSIVRGAANRPPPSPRAIAIHWGVGVQPVDHEVRLPVAVAVRHPWDRHDCSRPFPTSAERSSPGSRPRNDATAANPPFSPRCTLIPSFAGITASRTPSPSTSFKTSRSPKIAPVPAKAHGSSTRGSKLNDSVAGRAGQAQLGQPVVGQGDDGMRLGSGLGGKHARRQRERRSCRTVPAGRLGEKRPGFARVEQRRYDFGDLDGLLDAIGRDRPPAGVRRDDQKIIAPVPVQIRGDDDGRGSRQVEDDPSQRELARTRGVRGNRDE